MTTAELTNVAELTGATLGYGPRTLWADLDLTVAPGEFLAVLGPNGAGKSSLLRVLLGLTALSSGQVRVLGEPARRGSRHVGYVPQQRTFDAGVPLRGVDLVRFGLDGHRWGPAWPNRRTAERVARAVDAVGATRYAHRPIGALSGGEVQRLRIAQAIVGEPALLLADEPLLSLDLRRQREVVALLDGIRRASGTTVVFVTHEINPVLPVADRVLYLADGRWAAGSPEKVLTTETLTALYRSPVDVINIRGRVLVVGDAEHGHGRDRPHPHDHDALPDALPRDALPPHDRVG